MDPDKLLSKVTNSSTADDYSAVLDDIRDYQAEVKASSVGHDGRTPLDMLDEAEEKLSEGLDGWNEASISELLKEAIARISDEE